MAHRFARCKGIRNGEPILTDSGGRFKGTVIPRTDHLSIPLKRRKPTVYAVWNDFFHEAVSWTFQNEAYGVMLEPSNHIYLILTKRPAIMSEHLYKINIPDMPPNIYHGLTICNQAEADAKIPVFLQVPGRKFLSIEPMLGPLFLTRISSGPGFSDWHYPIRGVDAVILGGETGPGARPMRPDWVRSVRDQCAAAGVPFFFKRWGAHGVNYLMDDNMKMIPGSEWMDKGVKPSGRLLDGRTHDELPWR